MSSTRWFASIPAPLLIALAFTAVILSGLLVGYEPVGGDPDRMYRPLKEELARADQEGRLPYWSDRLGLGTPLLAESHVAAFYPPNQVLYRLLAVPAAYRIAMWLHYLALAAATYGYTRTLQIEPWGSALAALAFTFCGFQAIHSSHEWAYLALPFLPLALLIAERYLARGNPAWLPALALVWGVQLTLGHFQLQAGTAGLIVATALWRTLVERRPWWRGVLLMAALLWGAGLAAVQLVPSWEFARFTGASGRPMQDLLFYAFPPAHVVELALPRLFLGLPGGPEDRYWFSQQTTGFEACLYIGTLPLVFAFVGAVATLRDRTLRFWLVLVLLSFALATLPRWWPAGYAWWMQLPVVGFFRAPARYTLLTSFGLCVLAGRGFDRALASRAFRLGLAWAIAFGAGAFVLALRLAQGTVLRQSLGSTGVWTSAEIAALVWASALVLIVAWRAGRLHAAVLMLFTAAELASLYYHATTEWGWAVHLPRQSPVLARLAAQQDVRHIAGSLGDLPLRAGRAPAYPYLGMAPTLPNRLLEPRPMRPGGTPTVAAPWLRQFGVTHGVWPASAAPPDSATLFEGPDLALDRLVYHPPGVPLHATWRIVRYDEAYPFARAARRATIAPNERSLLEQLAASSDPDRVFYVADDAPEEGPGPRATSARVTSASPHEVTIDHDGTCDLILQRTYYPGWTASLNGGPPIPVLKAQAGLQAVRLNGRGPTRVTLRYEPTNVAAARACSLVALGFLSIAGAAGVVRWLRSSRAVDRRA